MTPDLTALGRETARCFLEEFDRDGTELPEEGWMSEAWAIDGWPGEYCDYYRATMDAISAIRKGT